MQKLKVGQILTHKDGSEAMVTAYGPYEKPYVLGCNDQSFSIKEIIDDGWIIPQEPVWKPKNSDIYFFIQEDTMGVDSDKYRSAYVAPVKTYHTKRYECGNCFQTKKEAEAMSEKIRKMLKGE